MGGGGSSKESKRLRKMEEERQERIAQGTTQVNKTFSAYGDPFFAKRATAYNKWALPQVKERFSDAREQLAFALARQGVGSSSLAGQRQAKLAKQYGTEKTGQVEQGLALANKARGEMEQSRQDILQQLQASADPNAAAQAAVNRSRILNKTDPYTPLGEMFANVTEGLAGATYPYGLLPQQQAPYGMGGARSGKSYSIIT